MSMLLLLVAVQEITQEVIVPEIAFTGDTTTDWISMPGNEEVLKAKLLIMELTFLDDAVTAEHARVGSSRALCMQSYESSQGCTEFGTHGQQRVCSTVGVRQGSEGKSCSYL